jgi:predicted  nucleic acid-binding Zn-ribbon protein
VNNVHPISKAAEIIGIDESKLEAPAKRYGALRIVAGSLKYIDIDRFNEGVAAELQAKIELAERRSKLKGSNGRKIGLLRARIQRAPGLIAAKEGAISAVRKQLDEAESAYEKSRAKKSLKDLEFGLKKLKDQLAKDEAELDRILNEEDES